MPSLIEIDESGIVVRDGKVFVDGQEDLLPSYDFRNISDRGEITLTNCHAAFLSTVRKARLIGVEIAYRKEPFWRRRHRKVTLERLPMEFDRKLVFLSRQFCKSLDVEPEEGVDERLEHVLRSLLRVDKDFNESSAKLKRSVLLIEKNFAQDVVEPLRKALIDGSTPDYPNVKEHATDCMKQMTPAVDLWQKEAQELLLRIMVSKPLEEATELNDKIFDLLTQVENTGWSDYEDEKFYELDLDHVFQRPDGPSSIIAYLNRVLSSAKDQSPKEQRAPSTTDLTAGKIGKP